MNERQRIALKAVTALAELLSRGGLYESTERSLKAALNTAQGIVDGKE